MTLKQLFKRYPREWSQSRLAKALDRTPSHICKLVSRDCKASIGLALAIETETGGLVRAEEVPMTPKSRALLNQMRAPAGHPEVSAPAATGSAA